MTSQIDWSVPVAGAPTTASVRANFNTAQIEITALQNLTAAAPFLPTGGGNMSGALYLAGDPTASNQAATKAYVDARGPGGGGGIPEAPADSKLYGRINGAWNPTMPIGGGILTGAVQVPAGTLAAPSVAIGSADTGLYRTGMSVAVSLGGVAAWTFATTGATAAAALNMGNFNINALLDPTTAQQAATKAYVDAHAMVDAPSDSNTYARRAAAWVPAVPVATRGNIALGTTEPSNVAVPAALGAHIFAWVNSVLNVAFNGYWDGSGWRYRSTGYMQTEAYDPTTGALTRQGFTTGTALTAGTGALNLMTLDRSGNVTFPGTATGSRLISSAASAPVIASIIPGVYGACFRAFATGAVIGQTDGAGTPVGANWLAMDDTNGFFSSKWTNAFKPGGGTWADSSDARLKTGVEQYKAGLAEIVQLRPVAYQFNGKAETPTGRTYIGLIAQEAQKIMPEMIGTRSIKLDPEDTEAVEILTLDATALIYALVNAVQELAATRPPAP